MTVGQLQDFLADKPRTMDVMIEKINDEYNLSLLEKAEVRECKFMEDTGPVRAKDDCLVLSDEI